MGGYGLAEADDMRCSCSIETLATYTSLLAFIHKSFQNKKGLQQYKENRICIIYLPSSCMEMLETYDEIIWNLIQNLRYQKWQLQPIFYNWKMLT